MSSRTMARGMLLFILSLSFRSVLGQVSYSIPEEMTEGSMVGNIAQDLGLDLKRLKSGKARIYTGDSAEYIELKKERGVLLIRERIDREALCEQTTPCAIHLQIILENPMEFFSVTVEINDVNDNSPVFKQTEMSFRISESAATGAVFALERAIDLDVGINGLQNYMLTPSNSFALNILNQADGNKLVEMILQKPLDREQQEHLSLVLTAVDGGDPQLSGTARIHITVLDANDNAPVFSQKIYKTSVAENAVKGTIIFSVSATDMDHGSNSKITYFITNTLANVPQLFSVNGSNGDVRVNGNIDYEKARHYHIHVQARDDGGLTDSCKIELDVIDVNDNNPNINIMSQLASIVENSSSGTVVTMINVQDPDSAENGKINCFADENIPFSLTPTTVNFFSIVTNGDLDRERDSEYNISVTCSDEGTPSLSSSVTLSLLISDVNDNAPVFEKSLYEASVQENNAPSHSICTVRARDADFQQNARVSYMLEESSVNGAPVSSIVSIGADSGVIHAIKSFDFEQIKVFEIRVKAQDGGSPPLSSNISVQITILDQNDNAPQILYPVQSGASVVAEIVPRSADVGYLVTKVVAVDVDSGQNAWLSYKLQKATDRALFEVGAQNGEIRTVRQVTDKDAVKQRLSVVVEDNGQPPRSATVNVNVALADSFPELLSEFSDFTLQEKEHNDNLTFYLVLALAVVSFLFIVSIIAILSVKCYRWRREQMFSKSGANLPVIPYFPPLYADVEGTGTLQHVYNYEVCRTADSRKSDHTFKPYSESVISLGTGGTQTLRHTQNDTMKRDDFINQKPPSSDWRFPPNQRPGPSGAAATPEVAVGTGPWPNPPSEAEQLQALMAAANEVSEATNTLTPGTMGLSTRYNPQFTLQHVPDYRQNVYIPGSTATLTPGQQQAPPTLLQQAPPPMQASAQPEPPKAQTPASKKKSTKKDKK